MKRALLTGGLALLVLTGCAQGPEPIRWGTDTCARCRMVISDPMFAAEFVETAGQVHKFDGVDELAKQLAEAKMEGKAYVTDGSKGDLVPAETAFYVDSPDVRSPMGGHLISFADQGSARRFIENERLSAAEVLTYEEALQAGAREAADARP